MLYFLLILCASFVGFSLYSRRFSNPYKLIFIFGKKGAGKSTLMVRMMLRDLKKGWTVYTDIQDCVVPGVRLIRASDLDRFIPVPAEGSSSCSVYLDEVGISFDNRAFKSFSDGLRDFFKLQRKYKCKVVMNSQAYDVDKKIRDCTDSMILQTSLFNCLTLSRPILRKVALVEASAQGDSRIADNLKFASILHWRIYFMPKYFKYFESFKAPSRPAIRFREIAKLAESPKKALHDLEVDDDVDD